MSFGLTFSIADNSRWAVAVRLQHKQCCVAKLSGSKEYPIISRKLVYTYAYVEILYEESTAYLLKSTTETVPLNPDLCTLASLESISL